MTRIETELEATFAYYARVFGLPGYEREVEFCPTRRWRFDFAWPAQLVAVECEGGNWVGGGHTSGSGFEDDCWKYGAAQAMGWTVLRFTASMLRMRPEQCIGLVRMALEDRPEEVAPMVACIPSVAGRRRKSRVEEMARVQ